jgi:hypothetical protein
MRSFPFAVLVAVAVTLGPVRAEAITLREVIDLTRAGLGEDVLLALIEIDQRVFPIDPATLRVLKDAGVSERVIVAIVRSGRTPVAAATEPVAVSADPMPPAPPEPQVVIVERERPVVREVAVPVAVFLPVPTRSRTHSHGDQDQSHYRDDPPRKAAEPVYWGWGGKRRPDAWAPSPDETTPRPQQRRRN